MKKNISSWGNTSSKDIHILDDIDDNKSTSLAIGNNNSYGDASISASNHAIKLKEDLDGLFSVNQTIEEYLNRNKFGLYGIPGKRNVTLGGAVASDVHGKDNIWGGSFIKNIEELTLKTSSGLVFKTSREKNKEIFYSTIGGYGLTGVILDLKIARNNLAPHKFLTEINIGEGIDNLLSNFTFEDKCYWVAWVDLSNKHYKWYSEKAKPYAKEELSPKKIIPETEFSFTIPFIGSNKFKSMELINKAYLHSKKIRRKRIKSAENIYYPLNKLGNTKNFAKNRKIIQIQFSIPIYNSDKIKKLLDLITIRNTVILCSVKRLTENESPHNLSFVQNGWTFALDFAYESFEYTNLREFYELITKYDGLVYLAKDSTLNQDEFKEMYKNYEEWKNVVKKIDPKNSFQSELSKRLGLKEW